MTAEEYVKMRKNQMSRKRKYSNEPVYTNGIRFDSKHEGNRYQELLLMQRAGKIKDLRLQVKFELIPAQRTATGKYVPPVTYTADFVYERNGQFVAEDAKGFKTDVYKLKKKLMLYIKGIEIEES